MTAASRAVWWNIFPAKVFAFSAKYENVSRKFRRTRTAAAYLLSYPNTRMQYGQFVAAKEQKVEKRTSKMSAIRMAEEVLARHDCSESNSEVYHLSGHVLCSSSQL
jgi:hypothetical protein